MVIDALKLNGIDTIFRSAGSDHDSPAWHRPGQALRVISVRHEQTPATPPPSPAS